MYVFIIALAFDQPRLICIFFALSCKYDVIILEQFQSCHSHTFHNAYLTSINHRPLATVIKFHLILSHHQ